MTIPELEKKVAALEQALNNQVKATTAIYGDLKELRRQLGVEPLAQTSQEVKELS